MNLLSDIARWNPDLCGKSVRVTNNNNGHSVTVTIADVCVTCPNGNSLDLSIGAFAAIANLNQGIVPSASSLLSSFFAILKLSLYSHLGFRLVALGLDLFTAIFNPLSSIDISILDVIVTQSLFFVSILFLSLSLFSVLCKSVFGCDFLVNDDDDDVFRIKCLLEPPGLHESPLDAKYRCHTRTALIQGPGPSPSMLPQQILLYL